MYCSTCGSQIKAGLNYCSRCGTKVTRIDLEVQKSISDNLSSSLSYIGVFGFIGFIFVVIALVKTNVHPGALILLSLFYLVTLLGICFMILRYLKTSQVKSTVNNTDFQNNFQPSQLEAADTAQLEEPRQQPISVTEHTTRTLNKTVKN